MSKESFFQDNTYYKDVLDLLDIAFWSVDMISGNIFLSKGAESLLGIPRADFEKNPNLLKEIIHPEDQYIFDLVADKLQSGMSNEHEFRVIKQNGEIRWIRGHSSSFKKTEMNIELFYGIIFDITGFIREQTELKNRNGSLENLINEVNIVVWNANLITNETVYSPSAMNIYGISHEEFRKNPQLWKELIHPDDRVITEKNDALLISGRKVTCKYRIIRPCDGEIRWIEDRAIPSFDQNGRLTSFFGVKIDVTHRKLSEEKINKLTFYDVLTGIPNNIFLENYLTDMASKKSTNDFFAFLLLNFDQVQTHQ
ncbi:PAS domain-containing protein [Bacillus sp. T3]|uniref:PAS domain-containing protein n=1 Tax=Bacillus sp. T3 TaxID=467262 RepID=UPI002981C060|nr:PAS domain-containing protein [Bacillus sp. T3]